MPPARSAREPKSAALFAQVFQGDIATLEACKNDLKLGTDTLKPGAVLIKEVRFWGTAKEERLENALEHVSSIGHSI